MLKRARLLPVIALLPVLALLYAGPLRAVEPDEILQDSALEARARRLSAELRCLVCQNQSIDDSNAPLAKDLRVLVRERLVAGDSDDAVLEFVVARYGKFVLLKPPFERDTLILWIAPLVVLMGIGFGILLRLRQRERNASSHLPEALSDEERARLRKLTDDN